LGKDKVILGYPWFTAFEPKIQWREVTLEEEYQPVVISTINTYQETMESAIRALETYELDEEAWEQLLEEEEEPFIAIRKTTTVSELAQKAMDHTKKTFEQMVPEQYHRHNKVSMKKHHIDSHQKDHGTTPLIYSRTPHKPSIAKYIHWPERKEKPLPNSLANS